MCVFVGFFMFENVDYLGWGFSSPLAGEIDMKWRRCEFQFVEQFFVVVKCVFL